MSERGDFFAVDRRCIAEACQQPDGLNLGAAHLVLARFTSGKNHSSTKAGMTALHSKLGLSRGRADRALKALENAGLISPPSPAGTRKLASWPDLAARSAGISIRQAEVLARVRGKTSPILTATDPDYQIAYALVRKGVLVMKDATAGKSKFALPPPDYLFLPNSLVDGFRAGDAPLARLRQIGDKRALTTLLRVYQHANLPEDGGLSITAIREAYRRVEAGRWGRFTIWAFAEDNLVAGWDPFVTPFTAGTAGERRDQLVNEFWGVWKALVSAQLVEHVTYVFTGEEAGGEPLHPFPVRGGTMEEREVYEAATDAALRMMSDAQINRASGLLEGRAMHVCPVLSHVLGATLVGIARPVHRANTSRTRAWAANFLHQCGAHTEIFKNLAQNSARATG